MPGLSYLPRFLHSQWWVVPEYPAQSFDGQTIIVTGANTGLGFEAAKHIVRLGAEKVILAVRNMDKGQAAKREIEQSTGRADVVEVWLLDLQSYDSVKDFAARVRRELTRLDVLLENAGISSTKYALVEGQESTITTNVISTLLLALLLLPKLRESAQKFNTTPHLTIVSSEVHYFSDLPERKDPSGSIFGAMADAKTFRVGQRYWTSKLVLILALQRFIEEEGKDIGDAVILNHVNPGFCHSSLMRDVGWAQYIATTIFHARSTEVGSRTLVNASSFGRDSHGQYLSDCKVAPVSSFVTSAEGKRTGKRVWAELKTILSNIQPDILQNV